MCRNVSDATLTPLPARDYRLRIRASPRRKDQTCLGNAPETPRRRRGEELEPRLHQSCTLQAFCSPYRDEEPDQVVDRWPSAACDLD